MQVTVEELSPVEKKLAIEIPWPYISQKLDEAYRDLGRGVALRGFRKGKVPRPILEKMYGQRVEHEVLEKLVQESFFTAASQHAIEPVAEPVVAPAEGGHMHIHRGQSFSYSARVEVRSRITPQDYDGIPLSQRAAKATEVEVTRALDRRRRDLTEFKVIEGRTELAQGDVVVVKVNGKAGERDFARESLVVELSDDKEIHEPLPGLGAQLLGKSISVKDLHVQYTISPDEARKELAGQPVDLKVDILESREKRVPALDDEFAKDTGEADTLEELRNKTREKLLAEDQKAARSELRGELIKEILKRNSFPVAPKLVERQLDVLVRRGQMQLMMQGIDPKSAEGDPETQQRLRDGLREEAHDEVRAAFLLDAISEAEKIEVTEADLEKRLAEMASAREKSVARLKAELQKEGRLDGVRYQLREEKTLDLLLSRAKITEAG